MGTFLTYRIAGGEEGMHHFLEQFGPALKWPWTKLMDVPELDAELIDRIARQSDEQARGLSVRELERIRDDNLVAILQALRARTYAAGEVLHEHETRLFAAGADGRGEPDAREPLRLHETTVDPSSLDYNGHMTESRYGVEFGYATDAFLRHVGLDAQYLESGHSAYTVEGHVRFLREVAALEPIAVDTQVLAVDGKRLHLFHSLRHGGSGELLATGEYMLLHVDTAQGRTCPWEEPVASRLSEAATAHARLPLPEGAGRAVSMPGSG
jgi:carnitine 3-dehydrogenase